MAELSSRATRDTTLEYAPARLRDDMGFGQRLGFVVLAYLVFTGLAALAANIPGISVTGQEMGFRRAVFAAVNATTLTGFQLDVGSSQTGADVLRLVLTLGGTLFSLTAGGMAVTRIARMRYTDRHVAVAAAVATLLATLGGAAFLYDADRGMIAALLQGASAFGNSGLYGGRLPGLFDWQSHGVLVPLAFAGALGIPVLMELFDRFTGGRTLSTHSRFVLVLAAASYLIGLVLIALLHGVNASPNADTADWRYTAALASAFSINARTAGLPFELAGAFSRPAQWALVLLMIVGGSPGGTAGGIKTTALYHLAIGVHGSLRGRLLSRAIGIAACWIAVYLAIVAVGFLLLLASEPGDTPDRLLFLAVSATSNVGLSHDPVSATGNGLFTLSAMMLAGRLAPILVLWWMASSTRDEDAVAVG